MRNSIGLIEVEGLVGALEAADAAAKAANVTLVGMEAVNGFGMVTVKIEGEVSAVSAGVEAGAMAASRISTVVSKHVIARPNQDTYKLIDTYVEKKDVKVEQTNTTKTIEEVVEEVAESLEVIEELEEIKEVNKNSNNKKYKK